jgi:hypothetical protein
MTNKRQALKEFSRRQLATCRIAYDAGVPLALLDAFERCRRDDIPPEPWMTDAALDFMDQHIGKTASGRGRTGNPIAKYKIDLVHFARWDAVKTVREQQKSDQKDREKLARLEMPEEKRRKIEAMLNSGKTFEDAVEGSHRTIVASYWKVERAMKDPEQQGRFFVMLPQTLSQFDIEI